MSSGFDLLAAALSPHRNGAAALMRGCGLDAAARLAAFRAARSVSALLAVVAFPLLAFVAAEPVAVTAALLLAGLLPFVVAQETRRPALLARGLVLSQLVLTALLVAGVLRGLPPLAAAGVIVVIGMEALLLGGRRIGWRSPALGALGLAGIVVAAQFSTGADAPFSGGLASLMAAAVVASLIVALASGLSRRKVEVSSRDVFSRESESLLGETILAVDVTGSVLRVSKSATTVLGFAPAELSGRGLLEMTLVSDRPMLLAELSAASRKGPPETIRFRLRVSAGREAPRYRWVEARLAPSPAADGVALMALRDASVAVEQEERLRRAQEEAAAARGARSAFLATINHELRTPLNAVLGFSEVMANAETRPADPARISEYAGLIHGAGRELLRTINAMIDVTRLESEVYELDCEQADLRDAVTGAVEAFREEHPATEVRIDLPHAPVTLAYDERALRTVILELLSNAAKFGRQGGMVRVGLRQDQREAHVFVRDEGAGIPADKVARIGSHFARLDDGLARTQGGVGLGLSLVNGLAGLHGGRVAIASAAGVGTTLTVTLPLEAASRASSNIHRLEMAMGQKTDRSPEEPAQKRERLIA